MPNVNPMKQTKEPKATFEDQPNLITKLTIQSNGVQETHRLIYELQGSYHFERMPTEEEMIARAKKLAKQIMYQNLGKKLFKGLHSKKRLMKLAASYVWRN